MTPTQAAAILINTLALEPCVESLAELVKRQPINLYKLKDYLEDKSQHQQFKQAIPYITYTQRIAVESEPLNKMRAIK